MRETKSQYRYGQYLNTFSRPSGRTALLEPSPSQLSSSDAQKHYPGRPDRSKIS